MQMDSTTKAFCATLGPQFQQLSTEIISCLIYSRIDVLEDQILDELAWQMHVDFYDTDLTVDKKRLLIKNSLKWHKTKGTPAAVNEVINTVFNTGEVKEWFEYGGDPYTFRVVIENEIIEIPKIYELSNAINSVKNMRSHLECYYGYFICGTFDCGQYQY